MTTLDMQVSENSLVNRNITVSGRRTSVRLEPEMWQALTDAAEREQCSIHDICSVIDQSKKPETSLTAAIRVFIMLYYRAATTDEGHRRARHGNVLAMMERAGGLEIHNQIHKPKLAEKSRASG